MRPAPLSVLRSAAVLAALLFLLSACEDHAARRELRGATMGTTWSLVYTHAEGVREETLRATLEAELAAINDALSTYLPESEISRVNGAAGAGPVQLSARFGEVLDSALRIGRLTGGAYDVTVEPLVELWGFGSRGPVFTVPEAAAIAAARQRVGAARLDWNAAARELTLPTGMAMDLSSIAKGYAVDRLAALVEDAGISSYLVEIGGELRAAGERPGGGPWRLAIESPQAPGRAVLEALQVRDAAVATSGDYRNYFEVDGRRYSHLVDARTGYPVDHDLVSVTVVHDNCMEADAWATALIVLGRDAALSLARERGLAVYAVSRDGERLAVEYTDAFSAYLTSEPGA